MNMQNNLGKILKSKGISQAWLASELGVTTNTVSNWTTQKIQPGDYTLKYIAVLIGCSYNDLIDIHHEN